MNIGDTTYNNHFRHMLLDALVCGLDHPVEWVENYSRGTCIPDDKVQEVEEFCDLVIKEL